MGVVTLMSEMKLKIDTDVYIKSGGLENGNEAWIFPDIWKYKLLDEHA